MDELRRREPGTADDALDAELAGAADDALDAELAGLFAGAFDDLQASDELKASTLAAIFAQEDEKNAPEVEVATATEPAAEAEPAATEPELELLDGGAAPEAGSRAKARTRRSRGWWMRVAAALVAVSLVTGGVAYATPASHVTVSSDDASVELGVNVFGRTVSVAADDDELQTALDRAGVRGAGYEEALDLVLVACDERAAARGSSAADVNPAIEVSGPFAGEGSRVAQNVDRVAQEHKERRARASVPAAEDVTVDEPAGGEDTQPAPEPDAGPGAEPAGELGGEAPVATDPGAAPDVGAPGDAGAAGEQNAAPQDAPRA